jgi:CheY-like chemotaxis protein
MLTIYIADDALEVRKRLVELVLSLPSEKQVIQAEQGKIDIVTIQTIAPDVIIMDLQMAGSLQVLKTIKTLKMTPLVIVLTAFPFPQSRRRCLQSGANYFLDKTNEFENILEILSNLLPQPIDENCTTHLCGETTSYSSL